MSPRRLLVDDLRNSAGDEERLSLCRLSDDDARRSCGFGDGRGELDIVRPPRSGRGERITGEEGGSGVCEASCRNLVVKGGALFVARPFGYAIVQRAVCTRAGRVYRLGFVLVGLKTGQMVIWQLKASMPCLSWISTAQVVWIFVFFRRKMSVISTRNARANQTPRTFLVLQPCDATGILRYFHLVYEDDSRYTCLSGDLNPSNIFEVIRKSSLR